MPTLLPARPGAPRRALETALLLAACTAVFLWGLGRLGLVDPDEPFYALTAREMLERGTWLVPHIFDAPQFEKPILHYWLTMAAFRLFGTTELAARLVPGTFAVLLVLLVHDFGTRAFRPRAGFFAALVLGTGLATAAMARTILTDVVFTFFLTGGIYAYWRAANEPAQRGRWVILHFVSAAFAVLTKGPLATLVLGMAILAHRLVVRRRTPLHGKPLAWGLALHVAIAAPWYVYMLWRFGWEYFRAFFIHENLERLIRSEHPSSNHWYYYPMILILGSIPWMPLLASSLLRLRRFAWNDGHRLLAAWFVTSLVFLTIVQSKLPSYCYFLFVPLALFMGDALDRVLTEGRFGARERWLVAGLGGVQALVLLGSTFLRSTITDALGWAFVPAGILLAVAVLASLRRPTLLAVAANAAAMAALSVSLLGPKAAVLEDTISCRNAAAELEALYPGDAPVVTETHLVRGVRYYTRRPVAVLAHTRQPFWTPQNVQVLVSREEVEDFVAAHAGAMCIVRPDRKGWVLDRFAGGQVNQNPSYLGRKLVVPLTVVEGEDPAPAGR